MTRTMTHTHNKDKTEKNARYTKPNKKYKKWKRV